MLDGGESCSASDSMRPSGRFRKTVSRATSQRERHRMIEIDPMSQGNEQRAHFRTCSENRPNDAIGIVWIEQIGAISSL